MLANDRMFIRKRQIGPNVIPHHEWSWGGMYLGIVDANCHSH